MKNNNEVTLEQLLNDLCEFVVKEEKKNMKNTDERVKIPTKHECVGNKLDILESRVTELEENNSRMLNIIDKQGDIIDELIEIARIHTNGFTSIYNAINDVGSECDCDCDCDAEEEELEAGKWYLAWDGEKKSKAVS